MTRRELVTSVGIAAVAWPLAARAQQPMPVIGYLGAESPAAFASRVKAFRQGLGEAGYVEGRNVAIEFRWADTRTERLPELAEDLVRQKVDLIVAAGDSDLARRSSYSVDDAICAVEAAMSEQGPEQETRA